MKISLNWLRRHIDIQLEPEKIAQALTACGLEVEGFEEIETIKGSLKGVVVGEVLTCEKHPDADRLKLTTVDVGDRILSIVCGAPNVAAGQKVAVALPGSTIYPSLGEPITLKKTKIRGASSEGMICAEDELGLGSSHEGILILPQLLQAGSFLADYIKPESDICFEIGLTANRGDAASHRGVARDLAAVLHLPLLSLPSFEINANKPSPIQVELPDADCKRYSGIKLNGIEVKESPAWIKSLLKTIGIHSINNVVDITNFVLHDIGQPIHAFDASAIKGQKVLVKRLTAGTLFTTLDETERKLTGNELMICDEEKPLAIAGVFGGFFSGVKANTNSVFIESAWFDPIAIRKAAKAHNLNTDASYRYERGADPDITLKALEMVSSLLTKYANARLEYQAIDEYPNSIEPFKVVLRQAEIKRILGISIPHNEIERIFTALEIKVQLKTSDEWHLEVPPFKSDVSREIDVIEELMRIYGLDNIPASGTGSLPLLAKPKPDVYQLRRKVSEWLSARGYNEVATNSMQRRMKYAAIASDRMVPLLNPLSKDLEILRPALLPSLLEVASHNRNRKQEDFKLYEFGKTYLKTDSNQYIEEQVLGILISGAWVLESWQQPQVEANFYHLKREIFQLIGQLGIYLKEKEQLFQPWEQVELTSKTLQIGPIAQSLLREFDLQDSMVYAELKWMKLIDKLSVKDKQISSPPKFPEVRRDLSVVIDEGIDFKELKQIINQTDQQLIKSFYVFDVFKSEKLGINKKALAIAFILRDEEKTLNEKEIDGLMNKLIRNFEQKVGASLRQ